MTSLRTYSKRIIIGFIIGIVVAVIGFVIWASTPAGEVMPTALQALQSSDSVTVSRAEWLVFEPVASQPTTGFIFYPGGRVTVDAYAPLGQAVADAGYLAVLVPMPLNLAVLDADAANRVIDAYPHIQHWAIGGHSLGGAMAARYVYNNPSAVDGLIMMAAFPEAQFDFTERDIVIASIYGELDGLATMEEIEASASQLPADTQFVLIEGGNHAQFGWYGAQASDNPATVNREEQYQQIIQSTLDVLQEITED